MRHDNYQTGYYCAVVTIDLNLCHYISQSAGYEFVYTVPVHILKQERKVTKSFKIIYLVFIHLHMVKIYFYLLREHHALLNI